MDKLSQLLSQEPYLLLDGAMGTMLMSQGLQQGAPPEGWNLDHPERIRSVHRRYIEAGSRVILTNSFGGSSYRLKLHNLQDRVFEVNRAAARLARAEADAAPKPVVVAGSMGPTGELLEPLGNMSFQDARAAFAEQARGLDAGGVDVLWIETMSDLGEVRAAVEGARSVSQLPIVATMSFDTHGRTMMGVTPQQALETLSQYDLLAVGANCGAVLAETEAAVGAIRAGGGEDIIVVAKANAGIPRWEGNELVYDGTPPVMADYARRARTLGARLIGACCGSTADHIRAMAEALADTASSIEEPPVTIATPPANGRPPESARPGRRADGRRRRRRIRPSNS